MLLHVSSLDSVWPVMPGGEFNLAA